MVTYITLLLPIIAIGLPSSSDGFRGIVVFRVAATMHNVVTGVFGRRKDTLKLSVTMLGTILLERKGKAMFLFVFGLCLVLIIAGFMIVTLARS